MKYPIAIEPGSDTQAWGVVVPDLPGCFSAADEGIDQAIENAKEAIEAWIEIAIESGDPIPSPSSITSHQANPEFSGWIWAVVEIDPAILDEDVERINITLPRRILKRLDDQARSAGETRSGYIASLSLQESTDSLKTRIAYIDRDGKAESFLYARRIRGLVAARIALVSHLGLTRIKVSDKGTTESTRLKLETGGIDPETVKIAGYEFA